MLCCAVLVMRSVRLMLEGDAVRTLYSDLGDVFLRSAVWCGCKRGSPQTQKGRRTYILLPPAPAESTKTAIPAACIGALN